MRLSPSIIRISLIIVALATLLCSPAAYAAEPVVIIKTVKVSGLYSIEQGELLELLDIKPGYAVFPQRVTVGIKRAFLKGIFDNIDVIDTGDGNLEINIDEKNVVGRINVLAQKADKRKSLSAFSLKRGDRFTPEIITARVNALEAYLRMSGYPEAAVDISSEPLETANHYSLTIMIDEGRPQTINKIKIIGRPAEEVTPRITLQPGMPFDNIALENDIHSLRKYYIRRGYLAPFIGPAEFRHGTLVIGIKTGKRLDTKVSGNEVFPANALIELMPFQEEAKVNDDLIAEAVERIKAFYYDHGFTSVQIAPVVKSDEESIKVNFYIHEGRTVIAKSVKVNSGSKKLNKAVALLINNRKGSAYLPLRLKDDAKIIADYFEASGFKNVKVMPPRISKDKGDVRIEIKVITGSQTLIGKVDITGNSSFNSAEALDVITVSPGSPYSESEIVESRRALLSLCRQRGHATCDVQVKMDYQDTVTHITYEVREGEKFFFGRTVVSGNRLTGIETIKKHILYSDGDPLDAGSIMKTKQRLLALGLFSTVNIEQIADIDNRVDIHIEVNEVNPGTVNMAFGYGEFEKFRAYIEIGYRNIRGGGNSGSLRLEANSIWKRYTLGYNVPFLFGWDLNSRSLLSREERRQENIDTGEVSYRVIKNTASTGIIKKLSRRISASLFYEYTIEDIYDVKPGVVLAAEEQGTLAIGSLSPAIYFNSLNDPLDPSKGSLAGLTIKHATESLFSQSEFTKITIQGGKYRRLSDRVIGAFSIKGGTSTLGQDTSILPVIERFYLGGRNTVRGYAHNSLGPLGVNGIPIGGNFFILANLEFRVNITGGWRTVVFSDCGNVWLDKADVTTGDLRCTVGTGIRYTTPVGPIRLDYGYKLDPLPTESEGELHFSIGHAF